MSRCDRCFQIVRLEGMAHERSSTIDFAKRLGESIFQQPPGSRRAFCALLSPFLLLPALEPSNLRRLSAFIVLGFSELRHTP